MDRDRLRRLVEAQRDAAEQVHAADHDDVDPGDWHVAVPGDELLRLLDDAAKRRSRWGRRSTRPDDRAARRETR